MDIYKATKKKIDKKIRERQRENEPFVINMIVKDDSNFLSVFSENETPVISSEVAEFIESSALPLSRRKGLVLRIRSNCIDDSEKIIYDQAVREYYFERYASNKRELKRNYFVAAALFLIGVFVLACSIFLGYKEVVPVWSEVVDIAAWVFLWEAVYIAFIETRKQKHDNMRYIAYISMNIEYTEE